MPRPNRPSLPLVRLNLLPLLLISAMTSVGLAGAQGNAPPPSPPNLLLITLDTTRADHLGAWGWPHARTPNLDALAARGTRFARCDTAAPITLPSHTTIHTGQLPPRHGVRDNGTFSLPQEAVTVAERLAARGYDTGAVVSATVLARRYGLAQGFRLYDDDLEQQGPGASERPADAANRAAQALLDQLKPPFFLWVHYFDPHEPYAPPSEFLAAAQGPHAAYDGEIAFMDAQLGQLLKDFERRGGGVTVVTGDHGEMLGEGGELTHGLLLQQGARRVPLLIAGQGVAKGRTIDCLVRTADITPTLLALAGAPAGSNLDGADLSPLWRHDTDCRHRQSYSESFLPFFAYNWYPPRSLSDGEQLYIHGSRPGLFDLASDPAETKDLSAGSPAAVTRWQSRLRDFLNELGEELDAEVSTGRALSAEDEAQLRALGYLGGESSTPRRPGPSLPDPRDKTHVDAAIRRASALLQEGEPDKALSSLRTVLRDEAESFPALNLAGLSLMETGRFQSALNAFTHALALSPKSTEPRLNVAACLLQLGRKAEAETAYRELLQLDPAAPGAASNLANLLRTRGETAQAAQILDQAFNAGSHHPGLYLERGLLQAQEGLSFLAYKDLQEATRRDPNNPTAAAAAASLAVTLERYKDAAQHYEHLAQLTPDQPAVWGLLGSLYLERLHNPTRGRQCFEQALALETDPARKAKIQALLERLP